MFWCVPNQARYRPTSQMSIGVDTDSNGRRLTVIIEVRAKRQDDVRLYSGIID
jgi:hypothetical protein